MTPARVRAIRGALGLNQGEFARAARLTGDDPARTVRRWEAGDTPVSGIAGLAIEYLGQGALDDTMRAIVPEYVDGTGLCEGPADGREIVIRLWRPRFVAAVVAADVKLPPGAAWAWIERGVERLVTTMWIDDPDAPPGFDRRALLERAASLYQARTLDDVEASRDA